jgi:hypothetical protein
VDKANSNSPLPRLLEYKDIWKILTREQRTKAIANLYRHSLTADEIVEAMELVEELAPNHDVSYSFVTRMTEVMTTPMQSIQVAGWMKLKADNIEDHPEYRRWNEKSGAIHERAHKILRGEIRPPFLEPEETAGKKSGESQ